MAPVDPDARTVAATLAEARTVAAPSGSLQPVQDTTPLDISRERYDRRGVLGAGGMGEVFLCLDRHIERNVALKVAHGGAAKSAEMDGRFVHEARVQGQLEHPSIVPVYDLGVGADGATYFTMKRVRGRTLAEVIDALAHDDAETAKQFTRRRLLAAFSSVCMAVHFAHSRGVLHRDLKPSNVMLGDFGEVYVLDWGLAKVMTELEPQVASEDGPRPEAPITSSSSGGHTRAGAMLGTPGYMSPEQAAGRLDELDERTDVYALGAILFELLTLSPLHEATTLSEVIGKTIEGADARTSVRAPNRDVPPELESLCVRATSTSRQERVATAGEVAEAIERFLDGDRDLERRRELSIQYARNAETAARRALESGAQMAQHHTTAMREVGRALAMDPSNRAAMRTLVELLSHDPESIPEEAKERVFVERRALQREGGTVGGLAFMSWWIYVPIGLAMGLRSPLYAVAMYVVAMIAATLSLRLRKHPTHDARIPWALLVASYCAAGMFAAVLGPYVLTSSLATMNTIAFLLGAGRIRRMPTVALGIASVIVPAALEWFGVVPRSLAYTPDGLLLLPRLLSFSSPATEIFLAFANIMLIVTSAVLASRFRDVLSKAEEKLHFHAWQLRQLMPEGEESEEAQEKRV